MCSSIYRTMIVFNNHPLHESLTHTKIQQLLNTIKFEQKPQTDTEHKRKFNLRIKIQTSNHVPQLTTLSDEAVEYGDDCGGYQGMQGLISTLLRQMYGLHLFCEQLCALHVCATLDKRYRHNPERVCYF